MQVPIKQVIAPNSHISISGEGMPSRTSPGAKGDLLIQFDVRFPTRISSLYKAQIAELLSE